MDHRIRDYISTLTTPHLLSTLHAFPTPIPRIKINTALIIQSHYLQGIHPVLENTAAAHLSPVERMECAFRNDKHLYNFAILDKFITALARRPDKAWAMRVLLADVLRILNYSEQKDTGFFLLAHLAFRWDVVVVEGLDRDHEVPGEEVEAFRLPTMRRPDGRELSGMERVFLERWFEDFREWVGSSAVGPA